MARISDDDIAKVREATDIISVVSDRVVLRQKGRIFWGLCPFHQEKSPSFKVDPTTQMWHCFGCGEGGDAFKFVMKTESLDFPESIKVLADRARIDITFEEGPPGAGTRSQRLRAVCQATADYYNAILRGSRTPGAENARAYLAGRNFGSEVAKTWNLGFAPGRGQLVAHLASLGFTADEMVEANVAVRPDRGSVRDRFYDRVMFPITDLAGRTIAFGGRVLDPKGAPKYLNSNDTPIFHKSANVYGIHQAKPAIIGSKTALVVEGYTDVIALHSAGFANAVATLGTALTDRHVKLLSRLASRVVYVFDGDEAGMRAADRAVEFIDETITPESSGSPVLLDVVVLPGGVDPADLVGGPDGAAKLAALIDSAVPLLTFAINRRLDRWDLGRPEEMQRALGDAASVLAPIKGSVMATAYAQQIVDRLWAAGAQVDLGQVLKEIQQAKPVGRAAAAGAGTEPSVPSGTGDGSTEQAQSTPRDLFPASYLASPEGRLVVQLVSLLVSKPTLRADIRADLDERGLPGGEIGQVILQSADLGSEVTPPEAIAGVERLAPSLATALSEYHFGGLDSESALKFGAELAHRLAEIGLQRHIRELMAQMRGSSDKESYMVQISALQLDLERIRATRS